MAAGRTHGRHEHPPDRDNRSFHGRSQGKRAWPVISWPSCADAMLAAVTAGTDMNDRDIYVVDAAADGQLLAAQSVRSGDTGRTAATAISTHAAICLSR